MTKNKLISKSVFIVLVLLVAGVSCANIRTLLWDDPWCSTWSADGSCCLQCSYRCYFDQNKRCQPVSDWCNTWDNCTGKCTSCYAGYPEPVDGVCQGAPVISTPEDDHCCKYGYIDSKWVIHDSQAAGCKKVCIDCDAGYYLTCNYTCLALPDHCKAADKEGACTECKSGYHVKDGKCVADVIVTAHCLQYGYVDSSSKWLSQWASGCKKVCKKCECDYYLTCDYTCVALPANCEAADIYGKCSDCEDGYHIVAGKCVKDDDHCAEYGYVDSGKKWYDSWVKGCVKVCKCCDAGYYLNCDYKCIKLPSNCKSAQSDGDCTSCDSGYHLQSGLCVKDDCHCAEYGYVDSSSKWASAWIKGCKQICKQCDHGYYLNGKYQCIALPAYCQDATCEGECTNCCHGYHVQDGECVVNDPNCENYGWVDCEGNWFSSWAEGRDQACKCCDEGYFLNCDNICIKIPAHCETVDDDGDCTQCKAGYHLEGDCCVVDDCDCAEYGWIDCEGKWWAEYGAGRHQECKRCDAGFYLDCDHLCQQLSCHCERANSEGECQCCDWGYDLIDGDCIKPKKIRAKK